MSRGRVAVADLPGLTPPTQTRVAGRIVHVDERGAVLCDSSGNGRVTGVTSLTVGQLAVLDGVWNGEHLVCEAVVETVTPSRSPFDAGADFQRLNADNRRLVRHLSQRARVIRAIREYFDRAGFLEVETPLSVPSPGLDPHLDAMGVIWRGPPRFLITSPEYQMKRLVAGGLERIYQLAKCFRNDETGPRHQPEFTMLEWYRGHAGVDDVMRDTEQLVAHVARTLHGRPVLFAGSREVDVTPPWPRITLREAFAWFAGTPMDDVLPDEDRFFRLLVESVEPALDGIGAAFLCEYPASMASLARKRPDDLSVAERFEAYVAGIELCNGFGELTDESEQRARLEQDQATRRAAGQVVYPIDEGFLRALAAGMPPSGGNALGVDRLAMLAVGAENIEDVLAVPASCL